MRPVHLLPCLALLLCGCAGDGGRPTGSPREGEASILPTPVLLEDFLSVTSVARCEEFTGPGAVRSLTPAGGGRFMALAEDGKKASLLDGSLRSTSTRGLLAGDGQTVLDPVDAWLLGDTLLVADGRGRALHLIPWGDLEAPFERVALPFVPHSLIPLGGAVGIIPLGGTGESMLFQRGPEGLSALPLPPPPLVDPRLRILAGALEATVTTEGLPVLAHPVLIPSMYRIEDGVVVRSASAIPDGEAQAFGRIPRAPFTDEEMVGMLAPALDLAPGVEGSVLVLTRSGGWRAGLREKAVLRMEVPGMTVSGASRLPVNALLMAGTVDGSLRVMDGDGRWHRCEAPLPSTRVGRR